ncbi:hypothetical protein FHG87_000532 [Trinorchestia longiramus]|nr:hypothetical protein FHG87_000532 [Trinorchestia longiramus]
MWLHGSLSSFFLPLLFTFHLARISSVEHRAWPVFSSTSPQGAMQRAHLRPRQFPMTDPVIKWSRQQSPTSRRESFEKPRMVDFHSGLWSLLGQISMNDFSQERSGLSKKFYDYYKGTYQNDRGGAFMDNFSKQKLSQQSTNVEPSLRSDHISDHLYNSELGDTKLKDLPPRILKALEEFGYVPEPQKQKKVVHIKTESQFHQNRLVNNEHREETPAPGVTKPITKNKYFSPQDFTLHNNVAGTSNMYVPVPSQISPPLAPHLAASEESVDGELHLVSSSNLPFKFSSENEIKIADGASSVLEISSESHPTKYFLSASYVNPLSPGQVKPLPIDTLFNSELFTGDDKKSLENEFPPLMNDYTGEKYSTLSPLPESPTAAVMNTVNKLDELFQSQNVFKFPDYPTRVTEDVSSDSSATKVSEDDFFSQFQSRLTALANHVDKLTLNDTNIGKTEPVIAQIVPTPHTEKNHVSIEHTEALAPIPEHVSAMVKNISDIIGANPSEDTMNAMLQHFSKVFQHAETILSQTFTEIPDYEHQTEPIVKLQTTQIPSVSILDSPRHVIIVYRPVLFVSHGNNNNSDWSNVVGQGYKPTVLNEHGETSEALTKEVLNTLGPDLLDSLKEHFASQLGSQLHTSGTRKFPDSVSEHMDVRKEAFHIRGDYIVIDGQDSQTPFVESATGEVTVQDDPQKKLLSVDLIVPQNTFRIQTDQRNAPDEVDAFSNDHQHGIKPTIDNPLEIATSPEKNSKPADYVHNIIVAGKSESKNKSESISSLHSFEQLKAIRPASWWPNNTPGEDNGKKYMVRRIVKRRRKQPTKLRSKLLTHKPSQLQISNIGKKSTDQTLQQERQGNKWRFSTKVKKLSEQQLATREEEGRKNDELPVIILEKPITDLPVERLADLVMKLYTSGT